MGNLVPGSSPLPSLPEGLSPELPKAGSGFLAKMERLKTNTRLSILGLCAMAGLGLGTPAKASAQAPADSGPSVTLNLKGAEGPRESAKIVSKPETIQEYARQNPEAQELAETHFALRKKMDDLRKTDPAKADMVLADIGETAAILVSDERFRTFGYSRVTAGQFNWAPEDETASPDLDPAMTPEKLRASLKGWALDHLTPEWAARQAANGNPETTSADGKPLLSGESLEKWLATKRKPGEAFARRWDKRLFPDGKPTETALRAARAMSALNALYAEGVASGAQPRLNAFATFRERAAVLSVTDALYGTENKTVDPILLMNDLAVLVAAVEGRRDPAALAKTVTVEVVRVKGMDALVARARAALPAKGFATLYGATCPAGAEEGSREHLASILDTLYRDTQNSFGCPAGKIAELDALRKDIRSAILGGFTVPVNEARRAQAALGALKISGEPGTPDRAAAEAMVRDTLPTFFKALSTGLQLSVARTEAGADQRLAMIAKIKETDQAKANANRMNAEAEKFENLAADKAREEAEGIVRKQENEKLAADRAREEAEGAARKLAETQKATKAIQEAALINRSVEHFRRLEELVTLFSKVELAERGKIMDEMRQIIAAEREIQKQLPTNLKHGKEEMTLSMIERKILVAGM